MKKQTGPASHPLQTTLCFVTAFLLTLSHACAAESPLTEIISLILSNQKNSTSFEDGARFDFLMHQLGTAAAKLSPAQIQQLNPSLLEDRIHLIALHRIQHRDLFDGIYQTYVHHPSEAELARRRQESQTQRPAAGAGKGAGQGARPAPDLFGMVDHTILAPAQVAAAHLAPPYRYCFEYYLIAPRHEATLRHYDTALTSALDHFKKQLREVDVRTLIETRLYTELEAHLTSLNLITATLDDLKDHLGPPDLEDSATLGYSFHIGGGLHAHYLFQHQDGKVTSFKRIPEADWRTRSDQSPTTPFKRP
ncbi:hypothetical protein [Prosthecobacter sp.]|uniref:hypothetical protein n=1 Tax=Prosthecobacter sp. TaxID=1965333 RepID=UPI003784E75F